LPQIRILDLGTGTGCLLLSLLHELPDATGLGIDIASRAVEQAEANAVALELAARAKFRIGNWLEGITETFDVVVSNPPYIAAGDIPKLMPEVREHDPRRALDGGADGLDAYRLLIPALPRVMNPGALAAFEVGQGQAATVADLFRHAGFSNIETRKDLGGVDRCVVGVKPA
jgi:release factor glutamine methyltransferase